MILYEFVCQDCHKEFEELIQGQGDKVQCPYCSSVRVKRLLSAVKGKSSALGADLGGLSNSTASSCGQGAGFS